MGKIKRTQPETPYVAQGRDLFQTPNYAVDLLIPFIPKNITTIWEPACGQGKIVLRLIEKGYKVFGSDIVASLFTNKVFDFLSMTDDVEDKEHTAIITNPPFSIKEKFVRHAVFDYGDIPFAMLIPADYCVWINSAIEYWNCEKIIPTRRIDYITPTGKDGKLSHSQFHSMWLTRGFNLGRTETFVELTNEEKKNNI